MRSAEGWTVFFSLVKYLRIFSNGFNYQRYSLWCACKKIYKSWSFYLPLRSTNSAQLSPIYRMLNYWTYLLKMLAYFTTITKFLNNYKSYFVYVLGLKKKIIMDLHAKFIIWLFPVFWVKDDYVNTIMGVKSSCCFPNVQNKI